MPLADAARSHFDDADAYALERRVYYQLKRVEKRLDGVSFQKGHFIEPKPATVSMNILGYFMRRRALQAPRAPP